MLSVFFIGAGLSMDACAVSFAQGMCLKKRVGFYSVVLGLAFGLFQAGMPLAGWFAGTYFESLITSIDHWIAFVLLGIIGINMIREAIEDTEASGEHSRGEYSRSEHSRGEYREEENGCCKNTIYISLSSILIMAVATSIDALAVGISFAFLQVQILPAVYLIGTTTFFVSCAAVWLGNRLGGKLGKYAEITGGVILILIGSKILLEHLTQGPI